MEVLDLGAFFLPAVGGLEECGFKRAVARRAALRLMVKGKNPSGGRGGCLAQRQRSTASISGTVDVLDVAFHRNSIFSRLAAGILMIRGQIITEEIGGCGSWL